MWKFFTYFPNIEGIPTLVTNFLAGSPFFPSSDALCAKFELDTSSLSSSHMFSIMTESATYEAQQQPLENSDVGSASEVLQSSIKVCCTTDILRVSYREKWPAKKFMIRIMMESKN